MKVRTWILAGFALAFAGCTEVDGQCWRRSDDGPGSGAGGGPIGPGWGGYGEVPPTPQGTGDGTTPPDCYSIGTFSASLFKFTTTLADDGTDVGGGYQEATATGVKFFDGRQDPPASWTCTIWVGMPLRNAQQGKISAGRAADMTVDVLDITASVTMHSKPVWVPGAFCGQLGKDMVKVFPKLYPNLGASARGQ